MEIRTRRVEIRLDQTVAVISDDKRMVRMSTGIETDASIDPVRAVVLVLVWIGFAAIGRRSNRHTPNVQAD